MTWVITMYDSFGNGREGGVLFFPLLCLNR